MIAGIRRWFTLFAVIAVAVFATQNFAVADGQRYHDEIFASSTVTSDIAYGQALDENGNPVTLRLDLYQPTGDTETSRPAYIWAHGGAFVSGDKADPTDAMIADRFAKRGYVTASINYRLRPEILDEQELIDAWHDAQYDAQAAVRWFRANAATYHIDANRIGVGGYSAGAMTSLNVAYNSGDPGDSGNPGYPSNVSAVVDVSGMVDTDLMDAGEPPVLIVHGTSDPVVPYYHATDIVARAMVVPIPYELHTLGGAGHLLWMEGYTEQIVGWMSDFLFTYLAPEQSTPTPTPTPTPTLTPTPTPRPVGGIAELPPDADLGHESGSDGGVLAGAVAAGLVVLAAGGWHARRRYSVRRR